MSTDQARASATGIGSMPGSDVREAIRIVTGEVPDLIYLPELPDRGATGAMIGRSAAMFEGLAVDLQPAGWRLVDASGADHRRAVSLLGEDLDAFEELTQGYAGTVKTQVAGPWTLAASIELPRGDKVLGDHGARRELTESLAEGIVAHIADLRRRVPGVDVVVALDEPLLPAVLSGAIATASGLHWHRSVDEPTADASLTAITTAIREADAVPVAHLCAAQVPVGLLTGSGFAAISFDLSMVTDLDTWAGAFDSGIDLWPGVVPSTAHEAFGDAEAIRRVRSFFAGLGFGPESYLARTVVTPACGLAGAEPDWSVRALRSARTIAAGLGE